MIERDLHDAGVSDTEAAELLQKAQEFKREVEAWIATHHPTLVL